MNKMLKKGLTCFAQGLLALLPLIVTIYLVTIIFRIVERIVDNALIFIPRDFRDIPAVFVSVEIITAILMFVSIALFGLIVRTLLGKALVSKMDSVFLSIPVLKSVYKATRQAVNMLGSKKDRLFNRPVLVEYPSPGIWVVAFNTGSVNEALTGYEPEKRYTVFIPTTPNPTSGFLAIVPEYKIKPLNVSVEDAMKLVLTGGIVKT